MLSHKTSLEYCKLQDAIFTLKTIFEQNLAQHLNLTKVQAPLYLPSSSGLNDDLNGVEPPIKFNIHRNPQETYEVIQSLAKWKRFLLGNQSFEAGSGLYTDMRALRPSDEIDATHSIYVDQWDWERVISAQERNVSFLKNIVSKIYTAIQTTNFSLSNPVSLPNDITFVYSQELLDMYPTHSSKERESIYAKEKGAIFVIGVGAALSDGVPHDLRAPDYDDWTTKNEAGYQGLNGDLIVYSPELQSGLELSSMGIRVNQESLLRQLEIRQTLERQEKPFHKKLLNNELPLTIGGGIGQSRLAMFLLKKSHISEVQSELFENLANNFNHLPKHQHSIDSTTAKT